MEDEQSQDMQLQESTLTHGAGEKMGERGQVMGVGTV